jgi:hypothetical protein
LPKVVSRRAERRLDEIELFRLLTAVEKKPRDNRRILSVLRPTAEKVDELRGLPDKQLLDDWFTEFTRLRSEMQSLAAPRRGQRARRSDHRDR